MTRLTIDELEILTSDELGELLIDEVRKVSPSVAYIADILYVGCPINARDTYDDSALHLAAWYDHIDVVQFLISRGADIHMMNDEGMPAWYFANPTIRRICPELEPK